MPPPSHRAGEGSVHPPAPPPFQQIAPGSGRLRKGRQRQATVKSGRPRRAAMLDNPAVLLQPVGPLMSSGRRWRVRGLEDRVSVRNRRRRVPSWMRARSFCAPPGTVTGLMTSPRTSWLQMKSSADHHHEPGAPEA